MRHGTYSIVALDERTGELGVAVQSHWFSVGPLCAWARAGVGAVATQSVVEPAYGPHALDRLSGHVNAQQVLGELLAADPLAAVRQVAVIDVRGTIGVHTGADCIAHAGHVVGEHWSCQANMMARDAVPNAMSGRSRPPRAALGPPADRARRGRDQRRRHARAPVGGDGHRAAGRRAVAADRRPARRGPRRSAGRAAAPAGPPARLRPGGRGRRTAGRRPPGRRRRALPQGGRARTGQRRAAVLVRPRDRPGRRPGGGHRRRSAGRSSRTRTGWSCSSG